MHLYHNGAALLMNRSAVRVRSSALYFSWEYASGGIVIVLMT